MKLLLTLEEFQKLLRTLGRKQGSRLITGPRSKVTSFARRFVRLPFIAYFRVAR